MSKKKFLLLAPKAFELYALIVKNLEFLGYEVTHIEDEGYVFKYRSLKQRLYNLMRKTFFNDSGYKIRLKENYLLTRQLELLKEAKYYSYALVIRADFFDKQLIEEVKRRTGQLFSFHFDGISRDLSILDYIPMFDQFYVFDPADVNSFPKYKLQYSPNFYFDYPGLIGSNSTDDNTPGYVYYVSSYHASRVKDLMVIHEALSKRFSIVKFIVICRETEVELLPVYVRENMEIRHVHVTFEEQLQQVALAEVIIDLVINDHKGYSFRIIEGLKFNKKVITSNEMVLKAEFYHPNNFFVLKDDNYNKLDDFLKSPYIPIDANISDKYSFSSWLNSKINTF